MTSHAIVREPIDVNEILRRAHQKRAGAVLLFLGDVRNHSGEKEVVHLEYEAYPAMALKQIEAVINAARQKWPIEHVEVVHRFGKMAVSETTIAISVACAHRAEAYTASRYIIDSIKHTVPIWKKEFYADGSSDWSKGCEACATHEVAVAPGHAQHV